jgi:ATP synthase I subunit
MTTLKPELLSADAVYFNLDKRLQQHALWLSGVTIVLALFCQAWHFILSFVIGALIAAINFSWMKHGIDHLVSLQSESSSPLPRSNRKIVVKYLLRYALIGITLYVIFRFRFLDLRGAVLGLFLFVGAVLYECIVLVGRSLLKE